MVQAKPALVEASALNPICANAFAEPMSKGLGIGKQPLSCSLRNVARLSANETGIGVSPFAVGHLSLLQDYSSTTGATSRQRAQCCHDAATCRSARLRPCAGTCAPRRG